MSTENEIVGTEKEFKDIFRELCYSRSAWQVWADLMAAIACTLANACDKTEPGYSRREKEFAECIERLGGVEKPSKLFAVITEAFDRDPDQDFLGKLYMDLELGNHWKGQFFTPYDICRCTADMTVGENVVEKVKTVGWVSVNDPACGAGAMLIAAANTMKRMGINYQTQALFVANDIDRVVAHMCYIQLSLLGCPGYVAVANTLSNPVTGNVLIPDQKKGQEFWFTPFYFRNEWKIRRQRLLIRRILSLTEPVERKMVFYFDFEKGEYKCQNR